jgi:phosphate transport system permease protein
MAELNAEKAEASPSTENLVHIASAKTKKKPTEVVVERILMVAAFISVLSVIFITIFIFSEGAPLFRKVGIFEFLFGSEWKPTADPPKFGILPFIAGSLWVTISALIFAVPIGLMVGIFMAEMAKGRFARIIRSVVELLAGIPSVIYGLFGYIAIAPIIRRLFDSPTGLGVLTASIVLSIMVLPTIINITEVSLRAVPHDLKEGSLALGTTHWHTIVHILVPTAKSGIVAGVILGMGRAIGETMAVLMVAGNSILMPTGLLSLTRTLTMNIATDMKYASGDHWTSLFTTGIVLFVFILILNIVVQILLKRATYEK